MRVGTLRQLYRDLALCKIVAGRSWPKLLHQKWLRPVAVWLFLQSHIGSDVCGVAVQAKGQTKDSINVLTISLVGRKEALMTAIVTTLKILAKSDLTHPCRKTFWPLTNNASTETNSEEGDLETFCKQTSISTTDLYICTHDRVRDHITSIALLRRATS